MIWTILAIAVILFAPIGIIFLTKKVKFFGIIGAVALCYVLGLILAVTGIPYDKTVTTELTNYTIPIAIPLILFSLNLSSAKKLAKKSLLSFVLVCVSVTVVVTAAFFIARPYFANAAQFAGMASGLYTGGTPNLNAIGLALGLDTDIIGLANTSDFIVGGVYFLFLITLAKPVYSFFLDGKKKNKQVMADTATAEVLTERQTTVKTAEGGETSAEVSANGVSEEEQKFIDNYSAEYSIVKLDGKKGIGRLILVILLAVGCFGVSAGIGWLIAGNMSDTVFMTILMLGVTALGIGFSFWKPVKETKGTFQAGHYVILMFSLAISMSLDLSVLVGSILPVLLFMACVQTATVILHLILCKLCKIDADTAIITSTAGVYGPAFIPPMAQTLKNQNVMIPGLVSGILGYALGTFLGIGLGNLFLLF